MRSVLIVAMAVLSLAGAQAARAADEVSAKDYCFALLGFEGDGGPVFVVAEEKPLEKSGTVVGPPDGLVPAGFVRISDSSFEFLGTPAAGTTVLEENGFDACKKVAL